MKKIFTLICAALVGVAGVWATEGALNGKFTVNEQGKQVQFAPGNLQYVPSMGVWQFATSQTEIIGKDAAYVTANPGYEGAIDLFAWSEDLLPVSLAQQGWRMLTSEEWAYLLREEEIGYGSSYAGQATIGTQHGLVILPDNWTVPSGLDFSSSPNNWTTNRYSTGEPNEWFFMEDAGAVFLPCVGEMGSYWSATSKDASEAYGMYFSASAIEAGYSSARSNNYAVRLVKDVKETPTDIENVQSDNAPCTKVLRNGQIYLMYKGTMYNVQGKALKR